MLKTFEIFKTPIYTAGAIILYAAFIFYAKFLLNFMPPITAAALVQLGAGLLFISSKNKNFGKIEKKQIPYFMLSAVIGGAFLPFLIFKAAGIASAAEILTYFIFTAAFCALFIRVTGFSKIPATWVLILTAAPATALALLNQNSFFPIGIIILLALDIVLCSRFLNIVSTYLAAKNLMGAGLLFIGVFISGAAFPAAKYASYAILCGAFFLGIFYMLLLKLLNKEKTLFSASLLSLLGVCAAPALAPLNPASWFFAAAAAACAALNFYAARKLEPKTIGILPASAPKNAVNNFSAKKPAAPVPYYAAKTGGKKAKKFKANKR